MQTNTRKKDGIKQRHKVCIIYNMASQYFVMQQSRDPKQIEEYKYSIPPQGYFLINKYTLTKILP